MKSKAFFFAVTLAVSLTVQSKAAFININDSDPNNITLTAGDFEGGFYYDSIHLLTSGLGNSGSITFADGGAGHTYWGIWYDLNQVNNGLSGNVYFGSNGNVLSAFEWRTLTNPGGNEAEIYGSLAGYTGATYFTGSNLLPQDGHTEVGGLPFLSWSFRTENPSGVPDTSATLALLGASFLGLATLRRRFVA